MNIPMKKNEQSNTLNRRARRRYFMLGQALGVEVVYA